LRRGRPRSHFEPKGVTYPRCGDLHPERSGGNPEGAGAPAALARRNTPKEALRWGYVMNMGLDSFRTLFEKFARLS
jgi:hypothetical protein